jgi:S1-C subfamily serine protease
VLIADVVPGSPAATAGLQAGDVVVAVDQFKVSTPAQFQSRMSTYRIGQSVPLTVMRDGKSATVSVTPIDEDELAKFIDASATEANVQKRVVLTNFGLVLVADGRPGLRIAAIDPNGIAAAAGLEPGDRLLHEKNLGALSKNKTEEVQALDKRPEITVQVRKNGKNYWLRLRR